MTSGRRPPVRSRRQLALRLLKYGALAISIYIIVAGFLFVFGSLFPSIMMGPVFILGFTIGWAGPVGLILLVVGAVIYIWPGRAAQ